MGFLASVFGSRTRVNALAALVGGKKMTESELAAEASAPVSEVNRQFPALVASGLVRLERVGKSKVYSIDETHFLYPALKELFGSLDSALEGEARRVAGCVAARCNGLKAIILFGSVAARRARLGESDVDLLFITREGGEGEAKAAARACLEGRGVDCKPIVVSLEAYLEKLKKGDRFYSLVHAEGKTLYGEKPKRFG